MKKSNSSKVDLAVEFSNLLGLRNDCLSLESRLFRCVVLARQSGIDAVYRKSLQGVLLSLRSSICLMNNELYSGRFKDIEPTIHSSDSDELSF